MDLKIKLLCNNENRQFYEELLIKAGFVVTDEAVNSFVEENYVPSYIAAKKQNEIIMVNLSEIIIIESYGRDIIVTTMKETYKLNNTLNYYQDILKNAGFIRVSQSAIIQRSSIEKIAPGLYMRYLLTLRNKAKTYVTRSYYYAFKEALGL